MSYRCGTCNKTVLPKQPMLRSIETVPVTYPYRVGVNKTWDGRIKDDPGGRGWQTVREVPICFKCNFDRQPTTGQVTVEV